MPHIHEKIDFTVEVMIVHKNSVLLRKHDKYKIWMSVGGHIEPDEDPIQAALREVKEEVGLEVKIIGSVQQHDGDGFKELLPPRFLNRHRISETHEHVTMTYFARSDSNRIEQGDAEVSDECRWFTVDELDDPTFGIREHFKQYAREALRVANIQ